MLASRPLLRNINTCEKPFSKSKIIFNLGATRGLGICQFGQDLLTTFHLEDLRC